MPTGGVHKLLDIALGIIGRASITRGSRGSRRGAGNDRLGLLHLSHLLLERSLFLDFALNIGDACIASKFRASSQVIRAGRRFRPLHGTDRAGATGVSQSFPTLGDDGRTFGGVGVAAKRNMVERRKGVSGGLIQARHDPVDPRLDEGIEPLLQHYPAALLGDAIKIEPADCRLEDVRFFLIGHVGCLYRDFLQLLREPVGAREDAEEHVGAEDVVEFLWWCC
jgi:hypothetical protein